MLTQKERNAGLKSFFSVLSFCMLFGVFFSVLCVFRSRAGRTHRNQGAPRLYDHISVAPGHPPALLSWWKRRVTGI